jgi:hypothetical protein
MLPKRPSLVLGRFHVCHQLYNSPHALRAFFGLFSKSINTQSPKVLDFAVLNLFVTSN